MVCSSCAKQKSDLHPKKSRLMAGVTLYLCEQCAKAKMEPRYIIILVGRSEGTPAVADYIRARRYVGKDILAHELIA